LPVADALTPEQEALPLGAGLKSFRPTLEVLEGRALMSGLVIQTGQVFLENNKVIADQTKLGNNDLTSELNKASPSHGPPSDLQRSRRGTSSGTARRAEADGLLASKGIAHTFQLETGTQGRDKIADAIVKWWEMQPAIHGGPFLARAPFVLSGHLDNM